MEFEADLSILFLVSKINLRYNNYIILEIVFF